MKTKPFKDRFGRPGNGKGKVEGLVSYARRNLVPLPRFESFTALNVLLEARCRGRMQDRLRGFLLRAHADLIPENIQAKAPIAPPPLKRRDRPLNKRITN